MTTTNRLASRSTSTAPVTSIYDRIRATQATIECRLAKFEHQLGSLVHEFRSIRQLNTQLSQQDLPHLLATMMSTLAHHPSEAGTVEQVESEQIIVDKNENTPRFKRKLDTSNTPCGSDVKKDVENPLASSSEVMRQRSIDGLSVEDVDGLSHGKVTHFIDHIYQKVVGDWSEADQSKFDLLAASSGRVADSAESLQSDDSGNQSISDGEVRVDSPPCSSKQEGEDVQSDVQQNESTVQFEAQSEIKNDDQIEAQLCSLKNKNNDQLESTSTFESNPSDSKNENDVRIESQLCSSKNENIGQLESTSTIESNQSGSKNENNVRIEPTVQFEPLCNLKNNDDDNDDLISLKIGNDVLIDDLQIESEESKVEPLLNNLPIIESYSQIEPVSAFESPQSNLNNNDDPVSTESVESPVQSEPLQLMKFDTIVFNLQNESSLNDKNNGDELPNKANQIKSLSSSKNESFESEFSVLAESTSNDSKESPISSFESLDPELGEDESPFELATLSSLSGSNYTSEKSEKFETESSQENPEVSKLDEDQTKPELEVKSLDNLNCDSHKSKPVNPEETLPETTTQGDEDQLENCCSFVQPEVRFQIPDSDLMNPTPNDDEYEMINENEVVSSEDEEEDEDFHSAKETPSALNSPDGPELEPRSRSVTFNEQLEEPTGIHMVEGENHQKAFEFTARDQDGGERLLERIILKPVDPPELTKETESDSEDSSSSEVFSPSQTLTLAERRNFWERRSLGKNYKYKRNKE